MYHIKIYSKQYKFWNVNGDKYFETGFSKKGILKQMKYYSFD
jgi:hypothetical protein